MRNNSRITHATQGLRTLLPLGLLAACHGELAVVDDTRLETDGAGISGDAHSPPSASDAPCGCASSPTLTALGCDLSGGAITALSGFPHITPDGSVVAFGVCHGDQIVDADCDVLHWRAETGARTLVQGVVNGLSPDGSTLLVTSAALASSDESVLVEVYGTGINVPIRPFFVGSLSTDGAFVVGYEMVPDSPYVARWSSSTRLERMAPLPTDQRAFVTAFDDDASTLTGALQFPDGRAGNLRYEPFRITSEGGLSAGLGELPAGATGAAPSDISADGSDIVGVTTGLGSVFRWTQESGMVALAPSGELVGGFAGVSADGNVVASTLDPEGSISSAAFRWTPESGALALIEGRTSQAFFMNRSGSVIVGAIEEAQPSLFVWDEANGARELLPTLEALDVDLAGWELGEVRALSDDGNALVGIGTCGGVPTHYRIELPN
jgi:hypothetical protein